MAKCKEMNGVLGHDSALYTGKGTTLANEINFVVNPQVRDHSLNLLTSSPAHYHYAMDAPSKYKEHIQ